MLRRLIRLFIWLTNQVSSWRSTDKEWEWLDFLFSLEVEVKVSQQHLRPWKIRFLFRIYCCKMSLILFQTRVTSSQKCLFYFEPREWPPVRLTFIFISSSWQEELIIRIDRMNSNSFIVDSTAIEHEADKKGNNFFCLSWNLELIIVLSIRLRLPSCFSEKSIKQSGKRVWFGMVFPLEMIIIIIWKESILE